jgi:methylthioribulose-1-phosphate dehydratase
LQQNAKASVINSLILAGNAFYSRNWVLGSSGSLSAVVSRDPFQFVITQRGAHKGELTDADFLQLDELGKPCEPCLDLPSETAVHRAMIVEFGAQAVLHTRSVWSMVLSDLYANAGGLTLDGLEMLSGQSSGKIDQEAEWVPILENDHDPGTLSRLIAAQFRSRRPIHAILMRKSGLYTWGQNVAEAVRYVESSEFLLEVFGRRLHILTQIDLSEKSDKCI